MENQTNLYRLSNEVIGEIAKALFFYSKHNITKNPILVDRASRDLAHVYTTVESKPEEPKPSEPENDALARVKLENSLLAFDAFLTKAVENSGEGQCRLLMNTVQNQYKFLLEQCLKNS